MKRFVMFAAFLLLAVPVISLAALRAPGVLDSEDVMTSEGLSKYKVVGIKEFSIDDVSYDNVDDEEMRKLKREMDNYQHELARSLKRNIEDIGFEAFIIKEGESSGKADMIIEGEFTSLNLGSAAARFMFGFGAGQCGIATKGKLVDARSGDTLAEFEHETTSGLDDRFDKWQMISREVDDMADDITEFVEALR